MTAARRAPQRSTVLLAAILVASAIVRFVGIGWALPYTLHCDENLGMYRAAVQIEWNMLRTGWPTPTIPSYGALQSYVFIGAKNLVWGSSRAARAVHGFDIDNYPDAVYSHDLDPPRDAYSLPRIVWLMRGISAAMYTIAVLLAALTARRLFGRSAAVFTALAAGGAPALVQHANFFTGEAFITLGFAMLLHAAVRIAAMNRWRDYFYAAAALEIMVNAKITTVDFAIVVAAAAFQFERTRGRSTLVALRNAALSPRVWAACAGLVLGWCALNLGALHRARWYFSPNTWGSVGWLARTFGRHGPLEGWAWFYTDKPPTYLVTQVMPDALGLIYAVVGWVAMAWVLLKERAPARWVPLAFALGCLPLAFTPICTIRYVVPYLTCVAICVGRLGQLGFEALEARDRSPRDWRFAARIGGGVAVIAAIASAWFISVAIARMHLQEDNRVAAAHWIWSHARANDLIALGDGATYRPAIRDEYGSGHEPGRHIEVRSDCLFCQSDQAHTDGARFIAIDGWELRMPGIPRYDEVAPHRSRWVRYVREHGAPPGFHLAARFDNAPNLFGWKREESHSEILYVAFDHNAVFIYERNGESSRN